MIDIAGWTALSDKLGQTALDIFNTAEVPVTDKGFADEKVLALTLLARTWKNREAAMLLLKAKCIVEARTITRCCYENLYWLIGLAEEGQAFVRKMCDDEMRHRNQLGQFMFDKRIELDSDVEQRMRTWLRDNKSFAKAKSLSPKEVAAISDIGRSYIFYSRLSADASHPSVTALNRHIIPPHPPNEDGGIDVNPIVRDAEVEDTLELLCQAIIGVCIGVNQMIGGTEGGKALNGLAEDYIALSNKSRPKTANKTLEPVGEEANGLDR